MFSICQCTAGSSTPTQTLTTVERWTQQALLAIVSMLVSMSLTALESAGMTARPTDNDAPSADRGLEPEMTEPLPVSLSTTLTATVSPVVFATCNLAAWLGG